MQLGDREQVELAALRAGDPAAFRVVVAREHATLFRVARAHVADDATAADVVQETWVAAIRGLDRFEGRSSLRTWLVRITMNLARKRGARDARQRPVGTIGDESPGGWSPDRFRGADDAWPGHWARPPADWSSLPEDCVVGRDAIETARAAIERLPERQRVVVLLRDVAGWTGPEVCEALDITEANQRVLLHRGRSAVRRSLEEALA